MIWNDKGYLIYLNKHNENSAIADFYTKNHGKTSGIIFGASSKKLKNYLILGNKFHLNYKSKNDRSLGYFSIESEQINTPLYFDDKKKLSCIIYSMYLLKILTVENQENFNVYILIDKFFKNFDNINWIKNFILWELEVLKNVGYDINFKNYASFENVNGNESFIVKSGKESKIIPDFLIDKNKNPKNTNDLILGLKLVGDFLNKTILKPNNINFPNSRIEFVNLLSK